MDTKNRNNDMLIINNATYGDTNCTDIIKSFVKNDRLLIKSSNNIIGDTNPGMIKFLNISGEYNNIPFNINIKEGTLSMIPKSTSKKLGIFYSNNTNQKIWPSIYKSIETIHESAKNDVDIITCMWQPMPDNPFIELISWYTHQSHLNQILQILQCLFTAKQLNSYEYVSFLEHDVMYPMGYFDYPNIEFGEIYTNMNYGGINSNGWQTRNQNDEPLHQMTMRFDDAIQHFLNILPNALLSNSGNVEPDNLIRKQWYCKHEAIHINHGIHFTSHNSIYKKTDTYLIHPYWGPHSKYSHLFN